MTRSSVVLAVRREDVQAEIARRSAIGFARAAGYEPDPWQVQYLSSTAPQVLLNIARQSGKSTATATLALRTALYTPESLILLLSPGERQSGEIFMKVEQQYEALNRPVRTTKHTELQMEFANGSRIIALPGKEWTIRGISGARLIVIDEAARVDDGLYYAIRPMLAVSHGRIVGLSTPWGKRGWWYEAWAAEHPTQGEPAGLWECYQMDATQCPRYSPEWLANERRGMPELWFQSEYMTAFVDAIDQLFAADQIAQAFSDDVEAFHFVGIG